jgi:cytochrome b561
MTPVSLNQFLVLYTWFLLAALLLFMLLIARFYQNFSGDRSFSRFYLVPMILFGASSVRYTSLGKIARDPLADTMMAVGGVLLLMLVIRLYWLMIFRRRSEIAQQQANEYGEDTGHG